MKKRNYQAYMYLLSACCISPQDTFDSGLSSLRSLRGNRWGCVEPDYKQYIVDATLRRRMSRIVKMGVTAGLRCVDESGVHPDTIITSTGLGCLSDTEKFLKTLVCNQETLLNPTPFIQSTFNTVGAQLALIINNHNYNNTYVHRGVSFESALLDGWMQANEGIHHILVGCFDETTDLSFDIMQQLGFWKEEHDAVDLFRNNSGGTISGEGSAFFMFTDRIPDTVRPVKISGIRFFQAQTTDCFFHQQVNDFMKQTGINDIDLLIMGNNGDPSGDMVYDGFCTEYFPDKPYCYFKDLCGEYPTASSFALYLANGIMQSQKIPSQVSCIGQPDKFNRILIYNHQLGCHSLIYLDTL